MWGRASQLLAGLIAVPLALGLLAFAGCPHRSAEDSETSGAGDAEPITLAIPLQPSSALALIAHRNRWYREQGVKTGYYGSNINNLPMIRGLEKMGMRHAGIEMSMILRLRNRADKK